MDQTRTSPSVWDRPSAAPGAKASSGPPLRATLAPDFDAFRDCQRVLQFDAKIPDSAVHLGMAQQQLDSPQVASLAVDLRNLRAPHRVGAVLARLEPDGRNPVSDQLCVLPCRDMQTFMKSSWPEELRTDHERLLHPSGERLPRTLTNLKSYGLGRLALNDGGTLLDLPGSKHVRYLQFDEIAASQFAINRKVKERKIAVVLGNLKADPDNPNVLRHQRTFFGRLAFLCSKRDEVREWRVSLVFA